MSAFVERACAKINLTLAITGRRTDGYHELESLVAFASVGDELSASLSSDLSCSIEGPFATDLDAANNSVLDAARALREKGGTQQGVIIRLKKNLPIASGIGGGSADAAATLRLLSRLWNVAIPDALPASLGADVPVCMRSQTSYMSGIGEVLEPGPNVTGWGIVLVNPRKALMTKDIFGAFGSSFSAKPAQPKKFTDFAQGITYIKSIPNDLQAPAIKQLPEISNIIDTIVTQPGCGLSRMSGSGATCFGLFESATLAKAAAQSMMRAQPTWWIESGSLL